MVVGGRQMRGVVHPRRMAVAGPCFENSMKKIKRQSLPPRVNGDEQVEQEVPPVPSFCKR